MTTRFIILLGLLALLATAALAESPPADSTRTAESGMLLLPVLGYSPETELMGGAMCMYRFPVQLIDGIERQSSLLGLVVYTQKQQSVFKVKSRLYHDNYIHDGECGYVKFPAGFWGIGRDTDESSLEEYTPESLHLSLNLKRRLRKGCYLGFGYTWKRSILLETEEGGALAAGDLIGSGRTVISECSVTALYDLRDNEWYPTQGSYLLLKAAFGKTALGGDLDYRSYRFDARWFCSPAESQVLGVQVLGRFCTGETPFDRLSLIGGSSWMRGFLEGRYRDAAMLGVQAEYRIRRIWRNWGGVLFGGVADVARNAGQLSGGRVKLSYGVGLRYLFDPAAGLNIRFDLGCSDDGTGFYIDFSEAF
ncbi:MAG: BamA/TamA family outer membrane protein [bacterium]|nr:BamA/TamA family outer membrane protein [bacterium]